MKIVFDILVNLFQGFFIANCLIEYFGVKEDRITKKKAYLAGSLTFFIFLHMISVFAVTTNQQNIASTAFMFLPVLFSILFLKGNVREKIILYVVLHIIIMFSALMSIQLLGIYYSTDFHGVAYSEEAKYYLAVLLAQVIMVTIGKFAIYYYKSFRAKRDYVYIFAAIMIPVISVVMCCLIVYIINASRENVMAVTLILILLIAFLNVINLYLLFRESKIYDERLRNQVRISAYEQQQKDLLEIKELKIETEKIRHEMKRVIDLIHYMLDNNELEKAKDFIKDFSEKIEVQNKSIIYTDNVILNYLLNDKLSICANNGIKVKCLVTGDIEGIQDVDLHILLGNLLDNAIEAIQSSVKKELLIIIYSDETVVNIEIGNSTQKNAFINNPKFKTTKNDKQRHGYGIANIKEIVEKYNGYIEYKNLQNDFIMCKISLINNSSRSKTTVHVQDIE